MGIIDENWRLEAKCLGEDPRLFVRDTEFAGKPAPDKRQRTLAARKICQDCPVGEPCERAGHGAPGIWNGRSEGERKPAKKRPGANHYVGWRVAGASDDIKNAIDMRVKT